MQQQQHQQHEKPHTSRLVSSDVVVGRRDIVRSGRHVSRGRERRARRGARRVQLVGRERARDRDAVHLGAAARQRDAASWTCGTRSDRGLIAAPTMRLHSMHGTDTHARYLSIERRADSVDTGSEHDLTRDRARVSDRISGIEPTHHTLECHGTTRAGDRRVHNHGWLAC